MASPSGQFIPTPPLEMQPQVSPYNPIGIGETALSIGTGALAQPIASIYGAGSQLFGGDGKQAANKLAEALTYQPATKYGQASSQAFGDFADKSGLSSLPPFLGLPAPRMGAGAAKFAAQEYGTPIAEKGLSMYEQGRLTPGMKPTAEMDAWHGSPHHIEGKFDLSKVGTGEGAQAYGEGMYFAGNRNIGEYYQNVLGKWIDRIKLGDAEIPVMEAVTKYANDGAGMAKALERMKNNGRLTIDQYNDMIKDVIIPEIRTNLNLPKEKWNDVRGLAGNLYKVDIPDEQIPKMMDWDKPISQQQNVTDSLRNLAKNKVKEKLLIDLENEIAASGRFANPVANSSDYINQLFSDANATNRQKIQSLAKQRLAGMDLSKLIDKEYNDLKPKDMTWDMTGKEFYENLSKTLGSPKKASEALSSYGVSGIRYLDGASRAAGEGSSNFVVFKPETVKILEKNDVPVTRKELLQQEFDKLDK